MTQASNADRTTRLLPWATPDQSETFDESMKALATYKKRDPSDKGVSHIPISPGNKLSEKQLLKLLYSRRAVQGGRQCSHHETELLQDHGFQSVSGRYSVLEEIVGMAGR